MLRQISLGSLGLVVGAIMTVIGMIAYANGNSTLNLVGFFYGIPILLGGAALKSSEVQPAKILFPASETVINLRNQQATATQNQVRQDVTRYRYGISAHLDQVLEKLGMRPTDRERPVLVGLYEEIAQTVASEEVYDLVLRFNSPLMDLPVWQQKQEKLTQFFGPGIIATVSQPEPQVIDLHLTANKS